MHGMGLLYRDLKPSNVLLGHDGHCFLSDLGGVIDESGNALNNCSPAPFKPELNHDDTVADGIDLPSSTSSSSKVPLNSTSNQKVKRRFSVMGTYGYMAPEMVALLSRPINKNYSFSVDWFSFGVTLYKLMTGKMPFDEELFDEFVERIRDQDDNDDDNDNEEVNLFNDIKFPDFLSQDAINIMKQLLNPDEKKRLGSTEDGFTKLKQHPFFHDIDFDLLLRSDCTKCIPIDLNILLLFLTIF